MDYAHLGRSGLRVPALSFGTGTFGGGNDFFKAWGSTDAGGAARLIDICLDHGISLFDSADVYSDGLAEQILGEAAAGKRNRLLISTKITFPMRESGPNDFGASRKHLVEAVDHALNRLGIDYIDVLQLHGPDYNTPVEETLYTLDQVVRDGKVRYIGVSNFSGWHLMKSLAASGPLRLPALHCAPGLLFSSASGIRMGASAAWPRSRRRGAGLESPRLWQAHWENSPRTPCTTRHSRARRWWLRWPEVRSRSSLPYRRCAGHCREGHGQNHPPNCHQLAVTAPNRLQRHHWCAR
jgi:hypothetical protein